MEEMKASVVIGFILAAAATVVAIFRYRDKETRDLEAALQREIDLIIKAGRGQTTQRGMSRP
jgi:hypothetical protein